MEELRRKFPWLADQLDRVEVDREKIEARARLDAQQSALQERRRRARELAPRVVIYTVHGTFARNARWVRYTSDMCRRLRQALGERVRIRPVLWSGGNSVRARFRAAERLRKRIARGVEANPQARHFVIAHSHGGNVALSAIHDEYLERRVTGVVTLATPFLSARVVKPRELIDLGSGFFAALFAAWCVIFAGAYFGHGWGWWPWALAALAAVLALLGAGGWLNRKMHAYAIRLRQQMPATALPSDKLAVVRVEGDEALATLAGARLAGMGVRFFWRLLTARAFTWMAELLESWDYGGFRKFTEQVEKRDYSPTENPFLPGSKSRIASAANASSARLAWDSAKPLLWQLGPYLLFEAYKEASHGWKLVILALIGVYGLPAAIALLLVAISVPFGILTSLSLLPCGWTVPLAGPYLQVTAEPSPNGHWSVHQFEGAGDGSRLDHSHAYQAPAVWAFIAEWIKDRRTPRRRQARERVAARQSAS